MMRANSTATAKTWTPTAPTATNGTRVGRAKPNIDSVAGTHRPRLEQRMYPSMGRVLQPLPIITQSICAPNRGTGRMRETGPVAHWTQALRSTCRTIALVRSTAARTRARSPTLAVPVPTPTPHIRVTIAAAPYHITPQSAVVWAVMATTVRACVIAPLPVHLAIVGVGVRDRHPCDERYGANVPR